MCETSGRVDRVAQGSGRAKRGEGESVTPICRNGGTIFWLPRGCLFQLGCASCCRQLQGACATTHLHAHTCVPPARQLVVTARIHGSLAHCVGGVPLRGCALRSTTVLTGRVLRPLHVCGWWEVCVAQQQRTLSTPHIRRLRELLTSFCRSRNKHITAACLAPRMHHAVSA